ncbi:helicase-exonuclease AddAB subunit AddA [Lottiidibacillus patelloidae]|uniref:ATP-dependent helicase/nuclease subunit A n=1 Tax=Lottiidibacillus patelloidae TaxID=2670334 RepID=A0A263BX16_9BACI|nr:helicase-exonuclease AddAB subunit AddA [Lottiidibacillus patelloidae]OZM58210.1 helicase-exonuclease AddAB subunit AddA [Lottiidibacillus patelloidae]
MTQWTNEQQAAIDARGTNTLVAAAAGSGKTAVLVEHIISYLTDKDNPIDVDRLLVVTFTNAAAAEMKKRIGEALEDTLKEQPSSLFIRKQLSLLNRANISTLHSFCMNVIRRYYYKIDIDPAFRILDETEGLLLQEQILEEIFEEEYSKENNESFFNLVDCYSSDRTDEQLQSLIIKLYLFSQSHPWPTAWLNEITRMYNVDENVSIEDLPWGRQLLEAVEQELENALQLIEQGKKICQLPEGHESYIENFEDDQKIVEGLLEAANDSWQAIFEQIQTLKHSTLSRKKCESDPHLQDKAKKIREQMKKMLKKLGENYFNREPDYFISDLQEMAPILEKLVEVTKVFAERFSATKREKGIVDYNDLEHYCLQILRDESSTLEEIVPSSAAIDFQRKFAEVLVDEYQDTNMVQEAILQLVTNGNNMFMVGDVKQSIYRFRLAEPYLFISKYKKFSLHGNNDGLRIDLAKNFRSRAEVLDGTNFLFKQMMNEKIGEIEYDEAAELKLGANFPEGNAYKSELVIIDRSEEKEIKEEQDEQEEDLENVQLEARYISKRINELIGKTGEKPYQVFDKSTGGTRAVSYRDIVILLRATQKEAPILLEEFKMNGIPAYAELSKGYFDATEIIVIMSLLRVIDNPLQDIPFAAVLRSPIVHLSGEEMAKIRIAKKQGNYYDAALAYIEKAEGEEDPLSIKLSAFIQKLKEWRMDARQGSLADLIWKLFNETGYYDFVGGMIGGTQRQANLKVLYDRARQYESTSFRGLFRFLRFIERMKERGSDLGTARALSEQEDVVRIMTIHKSKGLEFPVVFIAGIGKQFNEMDLRKNVLMHKELGFGTKYINPEKRISYPTLPLLAMKKKMKMELLAEEMRVLYVALTRAKEKMYLVGTVKDVEKEIDNWGDVIDHEDWLLPDYVRENNNRYIGWIAPAIMRHRDGVSLLDNLPSNRAGNIEVYDHPSKWEVTTVPSFELTSGANDEEQSMEQKLESVRVMEPVHVDSEFTEIVEQQLSWKYLHTEATKRKSKQTVTEIKRQRSLLEEDSERMMIPKQKSTIVKRPKFLQEKGLSPAERGTAMHLVMQHVPLYKEITKQVLVELMDTMVEKELLTIEQMRAVPVEKLLAFFTSSLGERFIHAKKVEREVPFSFGLKANEAYLDWNNSDETVILQGVIDCLMYEDDGIVLIDFKSDYISDDILDDELKERYKEQIALYSKAVEEIMKTPLKEKYLFFFNKGKIIKM